MSIYFATDESEETQVATITGWQDVGDWIESCDKVPELEHLFEYGWTEPASALRDELAAAMKATPPKASVQKTLDGIVDLLTDIDPDAPVIVGNGITYDDDSDS